MIIKCEARPLVVLLYQKMQEDEQQHHDDQIPLIQPPIG